MTDRQENFILLMYVLMREVSKSDGKVDVLTEKLFPKVHFVKRDHIVKNLTLLLQKIINRNILIDKSNTKLLSWNNRIKKEISKLKSL